VQDVNELNHFLDARIPLIVIETFEEKKALDILLKVAQKQGKDCYRWSVTDGLVKMSFGPQLVPNSTRFDDPEAALTFIRNQSTPGIFALCDLHPFLAERPNVVRLVKDIALNHFAAPHTLVFLSYQLRLPPEIARYSISHSLTLPDDDRILEVIREEAKVWSDRHAGVRVKTDNLTLKKLVNNLQGLSISDVRRLVLTFLLQPIAGCGHRFRYHCHGLAHRKREAIPASG